MHLIGELKTHHHFSALTKTIQILMIYDEIILVDTNLKGQEPFYNFIYLFDYCKLPKVLVEIILAYSCEMITLKIESYRIKNDRIYFIIDAVDVTYSVIVKSWSKYNCYIERVWLTVKNNLSSKNMFYIKKNLHWCYEFDSDSKINGDFLDQILSFYDHNFKGKTYSDYLYSLTNESNSEVNVNDMIKELKLSDLSEHHILGQYKIYNEGKGLKYLRGIFIIHNNYIHTFKGIYYIIGLLRDYPF